MGADAERRVFDALRPDKDVDGFHHILSLADEESRCGGSGMNRLDNRAQVEHFFGRASRQYRDSERRGSILIGDVHPAVAQVAGALTPVPGGVGPLTIALLLKKTVTAAQRRLAGEA